MTSPLNNALDRFSITLNWVVRHPYVTIVFLGLLITLPLIIFGIPIASHDGATHAIRLGNFSYQLSVGDLFPKWMYRANGGLGGPTFFYYGPVAYYIASVFTILPISVFQQLGLASGVGVIFSGIASFLWLREISNTHSALLRAFLFLLMPYPVAHDVYVRFAFGESFAFVWIPLILFFTVRLCRGGRLAFVGLALSYGTLCMTHLPITFAFSIILILYVLYIAKGPHRPRYIASTIGGMALGAGIAAIYIIPAVAYQEYSFMHELREGHFHYSFWLMTTELAVRGSWMYFWMPFEVCLVALISYVIGFSLSPGDSRREILFWLAVMVCSVFLMLQVSAPIWATFVYLQNLQFPFRFNTFISIAAMPIIVTALFAIKRPFQWYSVAFLIVITIFGVKWAYDFSQVAKEAFHSPGEGTLSTYAYNERQQFETHPYWSKAVPFSEGDLEKTLAKIPVVDGERVRAFIPAEAGSVTVQTWYPRKIDLHYEALAATTLTVSQFYFPGWRARIPGTSEDLPISASKDTGLINITVPPGVRNVELRLEALWPEFTARWLSLACFLLTVGLYVKLKYRSKSNRLENV